MVLTSEYFSQTEVTELAPDLLGKVLVSNIDGIRTAGIIVETEAYRGHDDDACHAHQHGLTARTKTMYGPPGHAYVYICYGIHHLFNVVAGKEGSADAVLIRALQPIEGIDTMKKRRNQDSKVLLCSGPGKLSQALGITKTLDQASLIPESGIWIEDQNRSHSQSIVTSPRIGMPDRLRCKDWPWRFFYKDNRYVS